MKITLNKAEQKLAEYLAKARYNNARRNKVKDKKAGDQSNEFTDLNGIGGEIAFCKMFNLYPDTETDLIDLPDEDCTLHSGHAVDVKATKYANGRLIVALWKRDAKVDLYALMVGEFPTYRYVGMCRKEDVVNDGTIRDLGHGDTFALDQPDLTEDIMEFVREVESVFGKVNYILT